MAYIPLSRKFYTPYKQIPNRLLKQESIKYKCFLDSISNYAISLNSGFDTLYLKREDICAIHLLRMLIDACARCYAILLVEKPEIYVNP